MYRLVRWLFGSARANWLRRLWRLHSGNRYCPLARYPHAIRSGTWLILGVTLGWDFLPTRLIRFSDGEVGILPRKIEERYGEWYGLDGWPVDPATGKRLETEKESASRW